MNFPEDYLADYKHDDEVAPETLVRYHGSIEVAHGFYYVDQEVDGVPGSYNLIQADNPEGTPLWNVRRKSFTVVDED